MNNSSLRILQVSTSDKGGGAEKIVWDLFTSYRRNNQQSWLVVGTKRSEDPDIFPTPCQCLQNNQSIPHSLKKIHGVIYILNKIDTLTSPPRFHAFLNSFKGYEDFNYPGTWKILDLLPEHPDILHAHNLHGGYFDLRALPWLTHQIPTVLTLHDAWLLSGHCAHSFTCERWKTGCGNCPDLSIYPAIRRDATSHNWQQKDEIYKNSRLCVVTPCQWLMDKVNESILKPGIVASKVIPNGVDLNIYHPANQRDARLELGLPIDAKILIFVANGIRKNIWKDYRTLQSTLAEIVTSGMNVLCLALGERAPPAHFGEVEIRFVTQIRDPEKVARYYQAADLYIHPARAETFPTTILEALACGIPVVASAVGGIPEQIVEGKTGFLVPVGDAQLMAKRIMQLLADDAYRQQMGRQAADDAARRFGLERMVDEYLHVYWEMLLLSPDHKMG
ncbi:MAG: glycosyltransferase [Methanomicrobiales archaeon]